VLGIFELVVGRFIIPASAGVESQLSLSLQHNTTEVPEHSTTPQATQGVVVR